MKMYLISDNIDTQIGMRLAGIEGCVLHEKNELITETERVVNDKEIGILIYTEKAASQIKDYLNNLKLTLSSPLIIEIPDRHGSRDIASSINNMVSEAIGLKL